MSARLSAAVLAFSLAAAAATAMSVPRAAAATPTECDLLAGSPQDPMRVAPGVGFARIDAVKALAACAKDLAVDPGNARLKFNLGRAHEKAGDLEEAAKLYRAAGEQAYAAAQVGLATLCWDGRGGLAKDWSEADRLLNAASGAGDFEARRMRRALFLDGLFAIPSNDEILRLVRSAPDEGDADAVDALATLADITSDAGAEALRLYRKASDLGSALATQELGGGSGQ